VCSTTTFTRSGYVITPVVVWCEDPGEIRPDPREVGCGALVPLDDLDRPTVPRVHRIEESNRPFLSIPLLGTYIPRAYRGGSLSVSRSGVATGAARV
jgi:hypothetical protein